MPDAHSLLIEKLRERHSGDEKQLAVVFSSSPRLLVEAPAGYGKTKTMISRIAYLLATGQIAYPKRLLALTFSVNAAYKIKKDVIQQIPELLKDAQINFNFNERIFVSNYHGFCRNVLRRHGYAFSEYLSSIDAFETNDDADSKILMEWEGKLTIAEATLMSDFNKAVKNIDATFVKNNLGQYCEIIISKLLPSRKMTFNGILTLTINLFDKFPTVREFYNKYFKNVLVDEYQDTNVLSYWLVTLLLSDENNVIFLGDSLQRIYGFIGAVPNLLERSEKRFKLARITLDKNYRFASNFEMLKLDRNIRKNAEDPSSPVIAESANVNFNLYRDQAEESAGVLSQVKQLMKQNPVAKIAILAKQRGRNIESVINAFEGAIPYFYGLFTDEDREYIRFHKSCLGKMGELVEDKRLLTKKLATEHIAEINKLYSGNSNQTILSLLGLLEIFWNKLFEEYAFLSNEEKILFAKESFEHNSLKQYVEFIKSNVIFSTVHAAKGLEWDYVIIPDMEQDYFPNWYGLCGECSSRNKCVLKVTAANEKKFLEELSVFYVAVTRARNQVFFSSSSMQLDPKGNPRAKNISCFLRLPGIATNHS